VTASEEDVVAPRWVGRTLGAMAVTIRRATLDDLDVILDLRAEVAAEGVWIGAELPLDVDGDRARFTDTIESPAAGSTDVMFVAVRDDGTVVGNLSMQQRAGIATLGMAISLHHRGAGIGGAHGRRRRQYRRKDGSLWDAVLMGLVLDEDAPGHDPRPTEPPPRPRHHSGADAEEGRAR